MSCTQISMPIFVQLIKICYAGTRIRSRYDISPHSVCIVHKNSVLCGRYDPRPARLRTLPLPKRRRHQRLVHAVRVIAGLHLPRLQIQTGATRPRKIRPAAANPAASVQPSGDPRQHGPPLHLPTRVRRRDGHRCPPSHHRALLLLPDRLPARQGRHAVLPPPRPSPPGLRRPPQRGRLPRAQGPQSASFLANPLATPP
jgi:hypothetical protein